MKRWLVLRQDEKDGRIRDLKRQVAFSLDVLGMHICDYVCDFTYFDLAGSVETYVVEDFKSKISMTPAYRLKKKLMKAIHGIEIKESFNSSGVCIRRVSGKRGAGAKPARRRR